MHIYTAHEQNNTAQPSYSNLNGSKFSSERIKYKTTCIHKYATTQSQVLQPFIFVSYCRCTTLSALSARLRSGELRTQKLQSHLVRTQSLNVLPLEPAVGQYTDIHATLTVRDFFLAYLNPSRPFTCIFSKTSPDFSMCWLWLTHGSCVGPQNKIGHPAGCRFPC